MLSQQSLPGSHAWCQVVGSCACVPVCACACVPVCACVPLCLDLLLQSLVQTLSSQTLDQRGMSSIERKRFRRSLKRQLEAISRRESVAWNEHLMERKVPPPPPMPSGKGQPASSEAEIGQVRPASSEVVELPPGGGFKGQGKYGSLGLSLPLPDHREQP